MPKTEPFDKHLAEYERWFTNNPLTFESELSAIKKVLPVITSNMKLVEIGIGSGIFASALGIKEGIDPSDVMLKKAKERSIKAVRGIAEDLPFADETYDCALMITTLCFLDNVKKAFEEIRRILKEPGIFVIGFIDRESPLGKKYLSKKKKNIFYKDAVFHSTEEVCNYLTKGGFHIEKTLQTVFTEPGNLKKAAPPLSGHGKGCFVVIRAKKL